jgi:hypothetical protein
MAVTAFSFFTLPWGQAAQVLDFLPGELLGQIGIPHGHLDVGMIQDLLERR